jgi:acyl carrier protein phosphodiesterase
VFVVFHLRKMSEFTATAAPSLPEELQEIENKLTDPSWLTEILHMTVDRAVLEDMSSAGCSLSSLVKD